MQRIHIVGSSPRSGTSLLMEMMINSFEIDLHPGHEARLGKCPPGKGEIFLSKSPKDIVIVRPSLKMMKNLYVLYMMRDPRDSAVSFHKYNKEQYYGDFSYWKNFLPYYERVKDHPRFLHLKYEDLVKDPDRIQSLISDLMPFLRFKDKFSNFHLHSKPSFNSSQALGGLRKTNTSSVGNWRNHKARILGQIKKYGSVSEDLIRFGYEKNDDWLQELEGLSPDLSESHYSFFRTSKFLRKKKQFRFLKALKIWFCHTDFYLKLRYK